MNARRFRTGLTVVAVGALVASGVALGASPAAAAGRAQVNNCGVLEVKPTDLVITCADANSMLTELSWQGWSNGRAKGVGLYELNDCEPTCVAGTTRTYPVSVLLTRPKVQAGERVLTKLTMTFAKKSPTGRKKASVTLLPYRGAEPTPSASATPSQAPVPAPTAAPAAAPTPAATPTPSASVTAGAAVIPPPTVTVSERRREARNRLVYFLDASSKARGGTQGITSVTGYQANEEGADLNIRGTYMGDDYSNGRIWKVEFSCDANRGEMLRIVVKGADNQTTTIKEKRAC